MTHAKSSGTHRGQPSAIPADFYAPPPDVVSNLSGVTVEFLGDDGRTNSFRVDTLPLPDWHDPLGAAFAAWSGPAGSRRTLASAESAWSAVARFMRFLADRPDAPVTPERLTAIHIDAYLQGRARTVGPWAWREIEALRALFAREPLHAAVGPDVLDYLQRRMIKARLPLREGYSDGELTRLVAAARRDVAATRDRIDAGERLLATWETDPSGLSAEDAAIAAQLSVVAQTGVVPVIPGSNGARNRAVRYELARQLFVTNSDREAILILSVAVTARNGETIKELPAEHRLLDGRAVELRAVKRRRGPQHWSETVTWEIGPPHRELYTPGGLYLLLHRLMARSRGFSGSESIWSTWSMAGGDSWGTTAEHRNTFGRSLTGGGLRFSRWSIDHELRTDPISTGGVTAALAVDLRRVRTTVEVRRTRALGGHLPSAARSNSVAVLFANYLRGDPHAREWAEEVLGEAVTDAEQAALAAHRHTLADGGRSTLDVAPTGSDRARHDGAWTACTDPAVHPVTEKPCRRVSFLDCFNCGNCLITAAHLPAILALLDTLAQRRTRLSENDWWMRYGPAWAAIRRDVLPRFTPAELTAAEAVKPSTPLLELAENPWERP